LSLHGSRKPPRPPSPVP